ncbi:MAG: Imm45 family immunity protein, partial [Desulfobacterales bacterium]|nr:Imm45 family immunity protein [Desulfobacterales bacterium]
NLAGRPLKPGVIALKTMWKKLIDSTERELWRGTVFRFPAKYPYEDIVDYMIVEDPHSECKLSLMVSTGYKSGIKVLALPKEAKFNNENRSISRTWIVENWNKWIYQENKVEDVLWINEYPSNI